MHPQKEQIDSEASHRTAKSAAAYLGVQRGASDFAHQLVAAGVERPDPALRAQHIARWAGCSKRSGQCAGQARLTNL